MLGDGLMKSDQNDIEETLDTNEWFKPNYSIERISLAVVFILSMFGVGVTDYAPLQSLNYWGAMTVILAVSGLIMGWSKARHLGQPVLQTLRVQIIHWLATGVAVIGVFLLLKAGRLNYEGTGLVLLIVLGLATFLDGYRLNAFFSFVGMLIFILAIAAAYIEEYLWVLLIVMLTLGGAAFFWERYKFKKMAELLSD